MRVLVSVLFSAIAVFSQDPSVVVPQVPDKLEIPVQLSKTIDTHKCKVGDVIELKSLEPVLIGQGLVMPQDAKLHGRILGAASRQKDQPSWILLMVDRADWKEHSLVLHAFVAAQITMSVQVPGQSNSTFENAINLPNATQRRRTSLASSVPGRQTQGLGHTLHDATVETGDSQQLSVRKLDDLRMMYDKSGTVYLVSQKPHLKLPSGTMWMLRNHVVQKQPDAGTENVAANTH